MTALITALDLYRMTRRLTQSEIDVLARIDITPEDLTGEDHDEQNH